MEDELAACFFRCPLHEQPANDSQTRTPSRSPNAAARLWRTSALSHGRLRIARMRSYLLDVAKDQDELLQLSCVNAHLFLFGTSVTNWRSNTVMKGHLCALLWTKYKVNLAGSQNCSPVHGSSICLKRKHGSERASSRVIVESVNLSCTHVRLKPKVGLSRATNSCPQPHNSNKTVSCGAAGRFGPWSQHGVCICTKSCMCAYARNFKQQVRHYLLPEPAAISVTRE